MRLILGNRVRKLVAISRGEKDEEKEGLKNTSILPSVHARVYASVTYSLLLVTCAPHIASKRILAEAIGGISGPCLLFGSCLYRYLYTVLRLGDGPEPTAKKARPRVSDATDAAPLISSTNTAAPPGSSW